MHEAIFEMAEKMEKSVEALRAELSKVRTGRASLGLLDGITVAVYGSQMPLNQVGSLTDPGKQNHRHSAMGSADASGD